MSRPVMLFTGQWADLPFETISQKAKRFGYDGVELSEMTHQIGSPWHRTWDPEVWNRPIPNEVIRAYHAKLAGTVAG